MPCDFPLKGFRSRTRNPSGKYGIVFSASDGYVDQPITIPCGQCRGCRLERSRQWAIRCMHEASLYQDNCFLTLTYAPENLPPGNTLVKKHFQDFMKRLRKRYGNEIRYFHCGEYGDRFGRPHYHACLFNHDFPDKKLEEISDRGDRYYVSDSLGDLWPFGRSIIGDVTFESAAYVARYCMKKITGEAAAEHYTYIDEGTGEFYQRLPEYVTMSRGGRGRGKGGIGKPWLDKFQADVWPDDFVVVRGVKMKPPKFYDRLYFGDVAFIRDRFPNLYKLMEVSEKAELLHERKLGAFEHRDDNTPERLRVRAKVRDARMSTLKRGLD